jgi:hypothetical protein
MSLAALAFVYIRSQLNLGVRAHTRIEVRLRRGVFGSALLALAACQSPPDAEFPVTWTVRDSTWISPWDEMLDSMPAYVVVLASRERRDTLAELLAPFPIRTDDSTIWGLRRVPGLPERELFRWRPSEGLRAYALPTDMLGDYHEVAVSPAGEYVAYVALSDSGVHAVVRDLPSGPLIIRSGRVGGCDCDVDMNHARWVTRDSFEIAVASTADQRGWAIVSGNAKARRMHLRYVASEPAWDGIVAP